MDMVVGAGNARTLHFWGDFFQYNVRETINTTGYLIGNQVTEIVKIQTRNVYGDGKMEPSIRMVSTENQSSSGRIF